MLEKIIPLKSVQSCKRFFQRRQNDPVAFLILVFIFMLFSFSYTFFYVDKDDVVYVNDVIIDTTDDINKTVSDESVTSIEKYCFSWCNNLNNIVIPTKKAHHP